jgi:hypothetical protein
MSHRQWPIMFQLHKCNEKEFCGNMRADYYFTYYQCSCPHGLMCLQKDHETYNVSELLYTGSAYKAICTNWKWTFPTVILQQEMQCIQIHNAIKWNNCLHNSSDLKKCRQIQTEPKTIMGIRTRKLCKKLVRRVAQKSTNYVRSSYLVTRKPDEIII